jgi:hypothetical protein
MDFWRADKNREAMDLSIFRIPSRAPVYHFETTIASPGMLAIIVPIVGAEISTCE